MHNGTQAFETDRLICRRFDMTDMQDMLDFWASDPGTQLEYGEPVYTDAAAVTGLLEKYISAYEQPDTYRWAIVEKESGHNIGQIALCRVYSDIMTAEIEYCIGDRFRGHGYAGEALRGLIRYMFTHTDIERLEAYHRGENTSSGRVLERSSMHITDNVERFRREGKIPEGEVCYCIERDR